PAAILAYYRRQYIPNTTVVSIAGAVDPAEVRAMVVRAFEEPSYPYAEAAADGTARKKTIFK
ncbi:MAG: hypothetical protein ABL958_18080, partial [Bdellovibrionia bacterium]